MKKNKTRQNETFSGQCYPQTLPHWGNVGKHTVKNGALTKGPEVVETINPDVKDKNQPSLDDIWEWLGNPDRE